MYFHPLNKYDFFKALIFYLLRYLLIYLYLLLIWFNTELCDMVQRIIVLSPKMRLGSVLVHKDCHNKVPQSLWLKQQEFVLLQFWRPEVWDQDISKVDFF